MRKAFRAAFRPTLPVLFGYLFMGFAFGVLLSQVGFSFIWAFCISLTVFSGTLQFVLVSALGGGVGMLTLALMTLLVNGRYMFYGLSFIERFRAMGKAYYYMIFSLTDETYSLLCAQKTPEDVDEKKMSLAIALLDHSYWLTGSTLGALLGGILPFDTTGIDFAMTALFVVIFVDQWMTMKNHIPAIVGLLCGAGSLLLFGPDRFILISLVLAVAVLLLLRPWMPVELSTVLPVEEEPGQDAKGGRE